MKTALRLTLLLCAIAVLISSTAGAATHVAVPTQVPDETLPRINAGDHPAGFSVDSWQGPATGKSNWHARYNADGDYLTAILPAEAATLKIEDLASIKYFTKRPMGTPASRDWWIQIYTRPTGVDDDSSWYHRRYINNYNDHTAEGSWVQYSTDGGAMTFNRNSGSGGPEQTLAELIAADGGDLIEMFSVQTDSGWNGFDGYLDGLEIELTNGSVGRVNFEAPAPLPMTGAWGIAALGLGLATVLALVVRRRFAHS